MALDRLFGVFKVGDQTGGPGKEYKAIKDAMCIQYIDEADWGLPIEKILSKNMHRVFCIIEFKKI